MTQLYFNPISHVLRQVPLEYVGPPSNIENERKHNSSIAEKDK